MMGAISGIAMASVKQSMIDWFARDAQIESRRTARTLGLTPEVEKELLDLLTTENSRVTDEMESGHTLKSDPAPRRRERDARVDAWFAAKLTADQQQARKRMDDSRTAALTEKLATSAVQRFTTNLDLTEEQRTKLHETAVVKITRDLEEKAYSNQLGFGIRIAYKTPSPPVEEEASEWVNSILEPDQMELWKIAIERDQTFGQSIPRRVIGSVFDQLEKIKPSQEEISELLEK